jgi:hypothetical protein
MKQIAFVVGMLLLFGAAFSENYTSQSTHEGWMKITRSVQVSEQGRCTYVTGTCSATGAKLPDGFGGFSGSSTTITLTAQNIGPVARNGVELMESLAHVPVGASLTFNPLPSANSGMQASWAIGSLAPGESKSVYYAYSARSDQGDIENIPAVQLKAAPAGVVLSAPVRAEVGSRVSLALLSDTGAPVPDTVVQIQYPDGSSQAVRTNSEGKVSFTAGKEGFYTYSVGGFNLLKLASTEAQPAPEVPAAAASTAAAGQEIASSIFGLLPILAAIFAVAVIMLLIYNFLTSKKEEGEDYPQPSSSSSYQPSAADSGASYTQRFTFGSSSQPEQRQTQDATRDLVGSRKKAMEASAPASQPDADYGESARADEDSERQIAALEAQARKEGETSQHEEEIEKAIYELEAIRQKLRERKQQMESLEESQSQPESPEEGEPHYRKPEPRRAAPEKRAPQRVLPPKGKKLKFTTHGVKRR